MAKSTPAQTNTKRTTPPRPTRTTRTTIGKRALSLRRVAREARVRTQPARTITVARTPRADHPSAANYATRVLSGEFEPTALRARELAQSRGQSLHQLAHELGYAGPVPMSRGHVDLGSLSRTELSRITKYHISDLSRLFARRHPPSLTKLARVAAAYNATMDDTLTALGW